MHTAPKDEWIQYFEDMDIALPPDLDIKVRFVSIAFRSPCGPYFFAFSK